jgi:predicted dehydrogenase
MPAKITRRVFLSGSAVAVAAPFVGPSILRAQDVNSKLNLACVGVGGSRGGADLGVAGQSGVLAGNDNLVAFADTDPRTRTQVSGRNPNAKGYSDFRKMFDEMEKQIDAVVVATPDHMHAQVGYRAISAGKHCFIEKPMSHTVEEATLMLELTRKHKVQTAMGNQGHISEGWRAVCEYVWSNTLGDIAEVHAWTNRSPSHWPQGIDRPEGQDPVPDGFDWDLWLGPAPARPYKAPIAGFDGRGGGGPHTKFEAYEPFAWRGWWDFGSGAQGDMGCHILDGPFWALFLGMPNKLELVAAANNNHPETGPTTATVKYYFPEREGKLPDGTTKKFVPCTVTWYEGVTAADLREGKTPQKPANFTGNLPQSGSFMIGSKFGIGANEYGSGVGTFPERLPPASQMIPRVRGTNQMEWVGACKGGLPAGSNFEFASPLTAMVQFANLVLKAKLNPGESFMWDAKTMTSPDRPAVNNLIRKEYRKGWELPRPTLKLV